MAQSIQSLQRSTQTAVSASIGSIRSTISKVFEFRKTSSQIASTQTDQSSSESLPEERNTSFGFTNISPVAPEISSPIEDLQLLLFRRFLKHQLDKQTNSQTHFKTKTNKKT
jgi:hypothetical protein